jgi:hypothetical protein
MIDPDDLKAISFSDDDSPELPEISQEAVRARRDARRRRAEQNRLWLEKNMDWKPFGFDF